MRTCTCLFCSTVEGKYERSEEFSCEHSPAGYVVVERPEPKRAQYGREVKRDEGDYDASFEINIPNKRGGYTTVILKRSGNGYTGPQGEYYDAFPRVDELKVIYGS